jgi:hypothetical protein
LARRVLVAGEIRALVTEGVPAPAAPPAVEAAGGAGLLFWNNGNYVLKARDGLERKLAVPDLPAPAEIGSPWKVTFPPNTGAPDGIELSRLMSLHEHDVDGVRYFSGTATYTNRFNVDGTVTQGNRRLFLDLGRVEMLARVAVNGKDLGIYWSPPFRMDITDAVRAGENSLEVQVTNLWPNRLIGDEQLPPENQYENGRITAFPEWYLKGEAKPEGGRITFAATRHYEKDSPLLASGLLGPVVLRTATLATAGG